MLIIEKRIGVMLPFRQYLLVVLAIFIGCGSNAGGDGGMSDLSSSDGSMLRLRWFPVEEAEGYVLYIEGQDGEIVRAEEVIPSGCEHRSRDGVTAGLCQYDFPADSDHLLGKLSLSAMSNVGEGNRSRKIGVVGDNP